MSLIYCFAAEGSSRVSGDYLNMSHDDSSVWDAISGMYPPAFGMKKVMVMPGGWHPEKLGETGLNGELIDYRLIYGKIVNYLIQNERFTEAEAEASIAESIARKLISYAPVTNRLFVAVPYLTAPQQYSSV